MTDTAKNKGGRPRKENAALIQVTAKVSEHTFNRLASHAQKCGTPLSTLVRRLLADAGLGKQY